LPSTSTRQTFIIMRDAYQRGPKSGPFDEAKTPFQITGLAEGGRTTRDATG